jgi:GntR family transcriptional regulator
MSIKSDSRHLYLQVIDYLKQDIEAGVYQENEKFPSESFAAMELGLSSIRNLGSLQVSSN